MVSEIVEYLAALLAKIKSRFLLFKIRIWRQIFTFRSSALFGRLRLFPAFTSRRFVRFRLLLRRFPRPRLGRNGKVEKGFEIIFELLRRTRNFVFGQNDDDCRNLPTHLQCFLPSISYNFIFSAFEKTSVCP